MTKEIQMQRGATRVPLGFNFCVNQKCPRYRKVSLSHWPRCTQCNQPNKRITEAS